MVRKFYLDASIWRDYFEDRKDSIRPLGEFAFQFLKKCMKEKHKIILSDIVIKELKLEFSEEQIKTRLSTFEDSIIEVEHSKNQFLEAVKFKRNSRKNLPIADILHAIIARDNDSIMVSRDKHFEEIKIVETIFPENLI